MAETDTGIVTAGLVVIGDEVLSGRTKDKNIGYVAEKLTETGIQLKEVRIVADDQAAIVEAVNTLRQRHDYVFTTGGIGPTHDDITADAIGAAFGLPVEMDERALDIMRRHFRESQLTPARLRMTRMPVGAALIDNPVSVAPGFSVENVYVMAGVPQIMQGMLDQVLPDLRAGRKILSRTLRVSAKEGDIADVLGEVQAAFADIAIGSYPFHVDNRFGVNVVFRGPDDERLEAALRQVQEALAGRSIFSDLPGEDDVS
ncbi:competence/damage-inducible protein A [Dichotomicrobium thermohalophilum]|uniref:Molybdenum cofactor synthesis domain-containing protein n=1 Tax=Dichotomicrobium thermohalophilum TaxID=933063 RepID=A0A397QA10_9HYPH|nr:competence/damage-inducible protein A [Dichotomicrobium thermohalophilum]RIA54954.1 molybdenum cofactor synthesis domain-containing protein [Dichotomicrobium thermohalophilum]